MKNTKQLLIYWLVCGSLLSLSLEALKLDRVIVACDAHPGYLAFWPFVARGWSKIVGLKPTLILIADKSVVVDTTVGDVIRLEPLPNIATSEQAQVVRLLAPALFPDEGCIISDIDMMPLNKDYFIATIAQYPQNSFVVYRSEAYGSHKVRFPMCYNAALGKTFGEIFNIRSGKKCMSDIKERLQEYSQRGLGWHTDELMLTEKVIEWNKKTHRALLHKGLFHPRLDRCNAWHYEMPELTARCYIDAHMPRPYKQYQDELDQFMKDISVYQ